MKSSPRTSPRSSIRGGTTGIPKLAPHTHANEVAMALMMTLAGVMTGKDTLLCGLPLFHVNGVMVTGGAPLFHWRPRSAAVSPGIPRPRRPDELFSRSWNSTKPPFFPACPRSCRSFWTSPPAMRTYHPSQFALCGAAPLSVELIQRFEAHYQDESSGRLRPHRRHHRLLHQPAGGRAAGGAPSAFACLIRK